MDLDSQYVQEVTPGNERHDVDARHMRNSRDDQRPSALAVGFAAGASFFLYKPLDKDRLWKLVRATQGAMEQERRRTRRVPVQSTVRLKLGEEEFEGETVDVSMGGLLVRAPRIAPIGSSLRMSLQLSQRMRLIVAAGSVVRILGGNQMGIQLDQLSFPDSQKLREFLLHSIPTE